MGKRNDRLKTDRESDRTQIFRGKGDLAFPHLSAVERRLAVVS